MIHECTNQEKVFDKRNWRQNIQYPFPVKSVDHLLAKATFATMVRELTDPFHASVLWFYLFPSTTFSVLWSNCFFKQSMQLTAVNVFFFYNTKHWFSSIIKITFDSKAFQVLSKFEPIFKNEFFMICLWIFFFYIESLSWVGINPFFFFFFFFFFLLSSWIFLQAVFIFNFEFPIQFFFSRLLLLKYLLKDGWCKENPFTSNFVEHRCSHLFGETFIFRPPSFFPWRRLVFAARGRRGSFLAANQRCCQGIRNFWQRCCWNLRIGFASL